MEKKPVTRKNIAELCGVSISVVSRALNNSGYVEESKRRKIIETAEKLNYIPQPVAMSLQERRTKQLLYYCKDLSNEYYVDMYRGMCEAANKRGYLVTISGMMEFDRIKDTMVDGIIMPNEDLTSYYMKHGGKNYYLPVVSASYCNVVDIPKSVPLVEADMYQAMDFALSYLNSMGHKVIAYGFPYDRNNSNSRFLAWKNYIKEITGNTGWKKYLLAMNQNEMKDDPRILPFSEDLPEQSIHIEEDFFGKGKLAAQVFMERKLNATAIICFNDEFAIGMIKGFQEMGVNVPEQISVMGIDGTGTRKYLSPSLTTVNMFPKKQGRECANVLIDIIEKKNKRYIVHLKPKLQIGESVKNLHT